MLSQTNSSWRVYPPIPAMQECSICQGTGWELVATNGSATARRCPCVALTRTVRLKDEIQIPERYRRCTLESYHPATLAQTRGLAAAWRFVERFPDIDRGVIFLGGPGVGKTHLAVGILLELVDRLCADTLFVDFHSLPGLHWSLGGAAARGNSGASRFGTASLLVLDGFGAPTATGSQYQEALHILHTRWRARKPTLCTAPALMTLDEGRSEGAHGCGVGEGPSRYVVHQAHALLLGGFKVVSLYDSVERGEKRPLFGIL